MRILFIGNSHTYFNDMPAAVADFAAAWGEECQVTMIAHGGWFLEQHVKEPEVRFNILHGGYDYVVLQEHAHPFGPAEGFFSAVRTLNGWIREAGAVPVIYMPWSKKDEPEKQGEISEAHRRIAEEIDALLVPVGEEWWNYRRMYPEVELYYKDGAHASPDGSNFAAQMIWDVLREDSYEREETAFEQGEDIWSEIRELSSMIRELMMEENDDL